LTLRDFRYRPVGLASHGGRSTQAVDHLRQVVRGVLGVAIPTQVCTQETDFSDDADGDGLYEVSDPDILARIERFADELVLFARHLAALRADMAEQGR
jgi:azobenzene reductase